MYTVSKGRVIDEDDPNDETKIPKTATDLRFPLIPLELRQTSLEKIAKCIVFVRDLERRLILKTNNPADLLKARERISIIKTKIGFKHIMVRCEFKTCAKGQPEIPVYQNLCATCYGNLPDDSPGSPTSLVSDLISVSNLINRFLFLEEQMSMSLSNLLTEPELKAAYAEINSLGDCI